MAWEISQQNLRREIKTVPPDTSRLISLKYQDPSIFKVSDLFCILINVAVNVYRTHRYAVRQNHQDITL